MSMSDAVEQTGEPLAALAHRLWTYWSQNLAEEEEISEERLERWEDLWIPYEELPEAIKDVDRELVERFAEEMPNYERCPKCLGCGKEEVVGGMFGHQECSRCNGTGEVKVDG
jgi:hypothetical protein